MLFISKFSKKKKFVSTKKQSQTKISQFNELKKDILQLTTRLEELEAEYHLIHDKVDNLKHKVLWFTHCVIQIFIAKYQYLQQISTYKDKIPRMASFMAIVQVYSNNIKCTNGMIESGTASHSAWEWKWVSSEGYLK